MRRMMFIALLTMMMACSDSKPKAPEKLPEDELPAYLEAVKTIYGYITLEDSAYNLTISKEKAAELGIPAKYYDRMKQDLDYTNHLIREYNHQGHHVTLQRMPITIDEFDREDSMPEAADYYQGV